jgi:hypothetical protein
VQDCSHCTQTFSSRQLRQSSICLGHNTEVSNLEQLFSCTWAIMALETSTSSLSFRSSELSQPILKFSPLKFRTSERNNS